MRARTKGPGAFGGAGLLLPAAALAALAAGSAACRVPTPDASLLWRLEDPAGDDHGDGDLRYPVREDLRPGDLDLRSLSARAVPGGTLFEAEFSRPVAAPDERAIDSTGRTVRDVARLGFYTFNLDLYVDQDRVAGSGRTDTLPGRRASIDPAGAWERAVCLTPWPGEARSRLRALWFERAKREAAAAGTKLSTAEAAALEARIAAEAEATAFFPTRVQVAGSRVGFFVPDSFLGDQALPSWGYVVFATGFRFELKFDIPAFFGAALSDPGLFVLGIAPGVTSSDYKGVSTAPFGGGRENDPEQPPIVDLVVPPGRTQEAILRGDPSQGRRVVLPPVVPDGSPPRPPPADHPSSAPQEPGPQAPAPGPRP